MIRLIFPNQLLGAADLIVFVNAHRRQTTFELKGRDAQNP